MSSYSDPITNNGGSVATSSRESLPLIANKRPLVVIVGAGLAGLSCAYKLIELGHDNLLILEASNRAGGRIESFTFADGAKVELGAQWLHGERENPIYNWLKDDLNVIDTIEKEEVEFEGLFKTNINREDINILLKDETMIPKCLEILLDAKNILYEMGTNLETKCRPLEMFRKQYTLECARNPTLKNVDKNLLDSIFNWFKLYETIDNSCEDLSKLSIRAYSDWTDFDNGKMVKLKGGWSNVVQRLLEFVSSERVLFNCPVNKIEHSSDGVRIHLNNSKDLLVCDHCVVTMSLGVLKNQLEVGSFFEPPLERSRLALIEKFGFGVVNKIFLQFEQPFLQEEKGLKLLWLNENNDNLPNWTKYMIGFDLIDSNENILLAWIGGLGAVEMEQFSDEEIGIVCLKVIELFLPKDTKIPKLKSIKKSTWFSDKNFRGSYSYQSIETVDLNTQDLWKPIYWPINNNNNNNNNNKAHLVPRVQFAGEATALTMYATAHGAVISGWREAERLMKLFS